MSQTRLKQANYRYVPQTIHKANELEKCPTKQPKNKWTRFMPHKPALNKWNKKISYKPTLNQVN